jgi:ATP-dependent helicase HepA
MSAPFRDIDDGGTDVNLIKDRLQVLRRTFSTRQWQKLCEDAATKSRQQLQENPAFIELCRQKAEQARTHFRYQRIQTELRQIYEGNQALRERFDEEQFAILLEGIKHPHVHLDSGGFIILSGKDVSKARNRGGRPV